MIYGEELKKAQVDLPETKKKMQQLGKKNHRELDKLFHDAHEQVFRKIDCLACANCCKTTSPIFRDVDIRRIAKKQRMTEAAFIREYLRIDEDSDYVLKSSPCTFLHADNTCSIYEDRPLACREYPHTDRKNMHQILQLTTTNSLICPAVSRVISNIHEKKR